MSKQMDRDEYEDAGDDLLLDPPFWLFEIKLNNEPRARVFGPKAKHNWVMWRLSKYVIELTDQGDVSVVRYTNGEWREADDWRKLAH